MITELEEDIGPYQEPTDPYYRIQLPSCVPGLDQSWMKKGGCLNSGVDFFDNTNAITRARAKDVCHTCPVEAKCLEFALNNGEKYGVWGGLDEEERRGMYR